MDAKTLPETLVLLGHGTALDPESSASVMQHAAALQARGHFSQVLPAFWKQAPQIRDVLAGIASGRVFIVPMFTSDGYFSRQVIPRELGLADSVVRLGTREILYTQPVGTHPDMTEIILQRAEEVVRASPFPHAPAMAQTTLLIAGHGTGQNSNSRKALEQQVQLARAAGRYHAVHGIFLEEEPLISHWRKLTDTRFAVVVPFFIGEGLHVAQDIPVLLGESEKVVNDRRSKQLPPWRNPTEKQEVLIWYASSVGTSPNMVQIILDRVEQARRGSSPIQK